MGSPLTQCWIARVYILRIDMGQVHHRAQIPFILLVVMASSIVVSGQQRKEPMIIGENVGVDGGYCESAQG